MPFSLVETHKHLTSMTVFTVHAKTSLLYILSNDLCKLIETYIYARKKHPFTGYPAVKHPKHGKFAITDMRQKPVNLFLLHSTGVDFSLRNNFANSGYFTEVSVLVHNYNSLIFSFIFLELCYHKTKACDVEVHTQCCSDSF